MLERYKGTDGLRRLVEALRQQRIVEHDGELAAALAENGEAKDYRIGERIVEQGAADNDIYFILDGAIDVHVNDRLVARRGPRECIGEMVVLDTAARRSATVTATEPTCALKIGEPAFMLLAERFPRVWKPIAKVEAERLRERSKFHRPPNPLPQLFLGSSVEGIPLANGIVNGLKHDPIVAKVWSTPGIFSAGGVSIDILLKEVDLADFAAFVFGPDDKITSRTAKYYAPRDNVVFELGLFMGRLDRTRAFVIKDGKGNVKIPTDLLGVTPITYARKAGQDDATMLSTVCHELRTVITQLGVR